MRLCKLIVCLFAPCLLVLVGGAVAADPCSELREAYFLSGVKVYEDCELDNTQIFGGYALTLTLRRINWVRGVFFLGAQDVHVTIEHSNFTDLVQELLLFDGGKDPIRNVSVYARGVRIRSTEVCAALVVTGHMHSVDDVVIHAEDCRIDLGTDVVNSRGQRCGAVALLPSLDPIPIAVRNATMTVTRSNITVRADLGAAIAGASVWNWGHEGIQALDVSLAAVDSHLLIIARSYATCVGLALEGPDGADVAVRNASFTVRNTTAEIHAEDQASIAGIIATSMSSATLSAINVSTIVMQSSLKVALTQRGAAVMGMLVMSINKGASAHIAGWSLEATDSAASVASGQSSVLMGVVAHTRNAFPAIASVNESLIAAHGAALACTAAQGPAFALGVGAISQAADAQVAASARGVDVVLCNASVTAEGFGLDVVAKQHFDANVNEYVSAGVAEARDLSFIFLESTMVAASGVCLSALPGASLTATIPSVFRNGVLACGSLPTAAVSPTAVFAWNITNATGDPRPLEGATYSESEGPYTDGRCPLRPSDVPTEAPTPTTTPDEPTATTATPDEPTATPDETTATPDETTTTPDETTATTATPDETTATTATPEEPTATAMTPDEPTATAMTQTPVTESPTASPTPGPVAPTGGSPASAAPTWAIALAATSAVALIAVAGGAYVLWRRSRRVARTSYVLMGDV